MSENVTSDENIKKTVGFKVSPSEYNVFQQYAQLFHSKMVQDPDTKQPRRLLERPEIGLLIRNATYAYLVQYQYIIQEQQQQQQQHNNPSHNQNRTRAIHMVKER
jgi:hypothetical protein